MFPALVIAVAVFVVWLMKRANPSMTVQDEDDSVSSLVWFVLALGIIGAVLTSIAGSDRR